MPAPILPNLHHIGEEESEVNNTFGPQQENELVTGSNLNRMTPKANNNRNPTFANNDVESNH